ncbi:MAG: sugar ABC transporter permease [Chloroflexi bacterium]|nr:MAG: sugar ABC transporter permease [Chloroflexota bacterium]
MAVLARTRRRVRSGRPWPESWVAAAFVAPAALVIVLIVLIPLGRALWMSVFDIRLTRPGVEPFVGLGNYLEQLTSGDFWAATWRALYFTVVSTTLELGFGMGLALLMDQPLRWRWLLRTLVILPWALPLLTQTGLLHSYEPFLSDSDLAMWMVIVADVWKLTPLVAILLLAGLQSIDREVVEVARVDGAGPWQVFRHILLPLLTPVILILLVLRTMEAFKVFDLIWIMTHGGPANSTQTIAIYAYQTAYQGFDFGRGAALGYLIALVIMVLAAVYLRLLGRTGQTM